MNAPSLLKKALPYLLTGLGAAALTFILTGFFNNNSLTPAVATTRCDLSIKRLDGLNYIKPIMFVDEDCPSPELAPVREALMNVIGPAQSQGDVTQVSVYFRDLKNSQWTGINEQQGYDPGSLFKVPIMITYLKQNEVKPETLDRELSLTSDLPLNKKANYDSKSIELGQKYTVRELLRYMIAYSDNRATAVLNQNMETEYFYKLFADLGLPKPAYDAQRYPLSPQQFSLFMRTLYNAAYLNIDDSEYAASLLAESNFTKGLQNGLPKGTKLIHKFGESGTEGDFQLHESAIIYANDRPYLLTVMTRGKNNTSLEQLLSKLSAAAWQQMQN